MKKNLSIVLALYFMIGIGASGCSKGDIIRGKIISVDASKNEIVVKDFKTGAERTVSVSPGDIAPLKKDAAVKIILEAGTNKAQSVKLRNHRSKDKEDM
ncbi:MAG: hypothetical protein NTV89_06170 [Proteobacteria bacterium]|nr:hypothetical protein [Pseudomonadota bacterium]